MIWRAPMGDICRTSRGSTKDTALIKRVDGQDPQIQELLCLVLENITHKVHPTTQVEVISGTVREFMTHYLAENGRRIPIIGKFSINNSVQFWASELLFICNL